MIPEKIPIKGKHQYVKHVFHCPCQFDENTLPMLSTIKNVVCSIHSKGERKGAMFAQVSPLQLFHGEVHYYWASELIQQFEPKSNDCRSVAIHATKLYIDLNAK